MDALQLTDNIDCYSHEQKFYRLTVGSSSLQQIIRHMLHDRNLTFREILILRYDRF